jgi:hypothetical protein
MAINSYFYDSVNNDRPYSAEAFAKAFGIGFETGFLIREKVGGRFGFDLGGDNLATIYEGKAIVQGHFVEVTGIETLQPPAGTYSGQVVIRVDFVTRREATLEVKTTRTPIQTDTMYELPIYDVSVANGVITGVTADLRYQGGAVPNNHNHDEMVKWESTTNGVRAIMGKYQGTGKNIVLYLTTTQPAASDGEHRVWIQIDYV